MNSIICTCGHIQEHHMADMGPCYICRCEQVEPEADYCEHPTDDWVHEFFESSRGGKNDSYHCGLCGELMQVG